MTQLHVSIGGEAGSGKTTAMHLVMRALQEAGFTVAAQDDGTPVKRCLADEVLHQRSPEAQGPAFHVQIVTRRF